MLTNRLFDDMSNIFRSFDNLFLSALDDAGVAQRAVRPLLASGEGNRSTALLPGAGMARRAYPAVECFTRDKNLVFRVELPGVGPDDVEVHVVGERLLIRGRKDERNRADESGVYFTEVYRGEFERSFTLPEGVNTDKVQATHRDGVLEITMPAEGLAPTSRKVPIQIEGGRKKAA